MAVLRILLAALLIWVGASLKATEDKPAIRRQRRQARRVALAKAKVVAADKVAYPAGEVLVTTGYWRLTNDDSDSGGLRNGPGGYVQRMHMVMRLNTPMVIYGDNFGVSAMSEAKGNSTPALVSSEVIDRDTFEPCASHGPTMRANTSKYTHPLHLHSITLGCIWDGKMSLLAKAKRDHPGYKWYTWLDIGMHGGPAMEGIFNRWGDKPWPNTDKLALLPRDKISASHTANCARCEEGFDIFCHCIAATAIIIPAEIVDDVVALFYQQVEKCMTHAETAEFGWVCLSEQHIMTQMEKARPGIFHFVGRGYGTIAANLTMGNEEFAKIDRSDIFDWLSTAPGQVTKIV